MAASGSVASTRRVDPPLAAVESLVDIPEGKLPVFLAAQRLANSRDGVVVFMGLDPDPAEAGVDEFPNSVAE